MTEVSGSVLETLREGGSTPFIGSGSTAGAAAVRRFGRPVISDGAAFGSAFQ